MKLKTYPPPPTLGDTKEIIKFAWWPTKVEDKLIWLERYIENWVYTTRKCSLNGKLPNPIPYDTWYLESISLYSKPGFPDFKNIPCPPLIEGRVKTNVKQNTNYVQALPPPPPNPLDPDSRSLQTQINLKRVISGNPKMISEDFKIPPQVKATIKAYLKNKFVQLK
jgi:hypothetical protein